MGNSDNNNHTKLCLTYRVEPGCLGPNGIESIEEFCIVAEQKFSRLEANIIRWKVTPRYDKSLDEIEYSLLGKKLSTSQVDKYLVRFNKSLGSFEEILADKFSQLIESFLDHER